MLKNMKVNTRLFILIGMSVFFTAVLSFIGLSQLNVLQSKTNVVVTTSVPSLYTISDIRGSMNRVEIYEKRRLLNTDSTVVAEIEQVLKDRKAEVQTEMAKYEQNNLLPEEKTEFQAAKLAWSDYLTAHEQVLTFMRAGKVDDARALSAGEGMTHFNNLITAVDQWAGKNVEMATANGLAATQAGNTAHFWMIVIPIGSAVLAVILGLIISNSISRPVNRLAYVSQEIAAGDLDQRAAEDASELGKMGQAFNLMSEKMRLRLEQEQQQRQHLQATVEQYVAYLNEVSRGNLSQRVSLHPNGGGQNDPLILLGRNLNDMTENLQRMIGQVRSAASDLNSASAEILAATTQQASGASEQSSAIAQTTTTVEEVKTIATHASERAKEVTRSAQRTVEVSTNGQNAVQMTIESMTTIKDSVSNIAENILALSEQTQQIGEIIATVNEIAAQSNMLALNASVEAARAGEHGKGFAVVAQEVRSLAEQSRSATGQVKTILSEIQKATNATVMATEEGTKGVDQGVRLASQAQESILALSQVINESAQAATQLAAGGQQQVTGIDQVALAMSNINQATIQSLASTRQAERAAQNLSELAGHLIKTVDQYQL